MEKQPPTNKSEHAQSVYALVRKIPEGQVMTYGGIASRVGPPEGTDIYAYERIGPRWVGYAMSSCPDDVPWHRVVNAKGMISERLGFGKHVQKSLLEDEGVEFDQRDRIDLELFGWLPGDNIKDRE